MSLMRKVLILHPSDNIAVCLTDLVAGDLIEQDGVKISVLNNIPRGHKIASREIAKSEGIIKYGERMGHAVKLIKMGEHVHIHNILGDRLSTESS
jgi:SAF domain